MIDIDLADDGIVSDVRFEGGCDGNLRGMRELVKGRNAQELISMLEGIPCASKPTSCPDQLARALKAILEKEKAEKA
ncbi:MAG: TIGR03905 family TSCPD domain-containing protein [Oscillospiraceae bacterium]|nr:TIGR03905 family TSCPD domain-containing protein [Oscillospiraceae bacterium]